MSNRFYRVQGGALVDGGTGPPTQVDRKLPYRPADIGIDLSNPGYVALTPGSSFLDLAVAAAAYAQPPTTWLVDLGTFTRNVTVTCAGFRVFFLPFEGYITFDPTTDYSRAITGRRALLVQQFAAAQLQTFKLDGTTISDGLNLSSTIAGAAAQVQHFRIDNLRENYYDTGSAVALITAPDGSQPQYNHPDVIQSYGGPAILRVSNFHASSDRSFHTIATAGPPAGPALQEVQVQRGHYKQLAHPVLGDQRTYPFYWNRAAGDPASFPGTYRNVYYEHGTAARGAGQAFFPDGDPGYADDVLAGGIIESAPPSTAFWVPSSSEVGYGKTSPAYA